MNIDLNWYDFQCFIFFFWYLMERQLVVKNCNIFVNTPIQGGTDFQNNTHFMLCSFILADLGS